MNETREHIIIESSKLFLQKSFKEVTMQEIVTKTGLSKGAFYHYFKSKEQLFTEVLNYFFSTVFVHDYDSYSRESFHRFYHDYAGAIQNVGKKFMENLNDKENSFFNMNYFTLIFDALKLFPEFRTSVTSGFRGELEIWKSVISQARKNGEIKSHMSDEEIALTYITLADGVTMHMLVQGTPIAKVRDAFLNLWDKFYEHIKA